MRLTRAAARAAEAVGRRDDRESSKTAPTGAAGADLARGAAGSQRQEAREDGGMVVGAESIFNGASQPPQHETVLARQPGTPGQPQGLFSNGARIHCNTVHGTTGRVLLGQSGCVFICYAGTVGLTGPGGSRTGHGRGQVRK